MKANRLQKAYKECLWLYAMENGLLIKVCPTHCVPTDPVPSLSVSLSHSMDFLHHPGLPKQPEGERSAHWSSLESRCDSKFFKHPPPPPSLSLYLSGMF